MRRIVEIPQAAVFTSSKTYNVILCSGPGYRRMAISRQQDISVRYRVKQALHIQPDSFLTNGAHQLRLKTVVL